MVKSFLMNALKRITSKNIKKNICNAQCHCECFGTKFVRSVLVFDDRKKNASDCGNKEDAGENPVADKKKRNESDDLPVMMMELKIHCKCIECVGKFCAIASETKGITGVSISKPKPNGLVTVKVTGAIDATALAEKIKAKLDCRVEIELLKKKEGDGESSRNSPAFGYDSGYVPYNGYRADQRYESAMPPGYDSFSEQNPTCVVI